MPHRPQQDHDRFDRLYADNLGSILGYAARRLDDPADAADVAAEVFLVAWRRLADMPDGQERLWLFGVARRTLANHRRGQLRRSHLAAKPRSELELGSGTAPETESVTAIRQALVRLDRRDRELLVLSVWDGLTPSEIAALEGIPAVTVRSRLMRARRRLRAELGDHLPAEPAQRPPRPGHASGTALDVQVHAESNARSYTT